MQEESTQENKEPKMYGSGAGKQITFVRKGFTNITEMEKGAELQDEFRKFYLEERKAGRTDLMQIFREYRKNLQLYSKIWFNPYPAVIQGWIRIWEQSLPIHVRKVAIKGRDVTKNQKDEKKALTNEVRQIEYHELEDGAKNLQTLLLEDANELMKESNTEYTLLDSNGGFWSKEEWEKIRIKKKALALNIAKDILSGVHKHQGIQIKRNKEGRETASFLMDIMHQATAGELTEADIALLDSSIPKV